MKGRLIVFEGPDGAGKSTQAGLLAGYLRARGRQVREVREPGSTALGEKVRTILLHGPEEHMAMRTELLLYMACRAQLTSEVLQPALTAGEVVICDRFVYSSLAYQGYGGGLDPAEIMRIGMFAASGLRPDAVFLLDLEVKDGRARIPGARDRVEARDAAFHERVRKGFLAIAREVPDLFVILDATLPAATLAEQIKERLPDELR